MDNQITISPRGQQAFAVPQSINLAFMSGRGSGDSTIAGQLVSRDISEYGDPVRALVIRQSYAGLTDFESLFFELCHKIYGMKGFSYNKTSKIFTFRHTTATVCLSQMQDERDYYKHQGQSITLLVVDECQQFPNPDLIDRLQSNLRGPSNIPLRTILLANPGDVGHAWLAQRHGLKKSWIPYTDPKTGKEWVTIGGTFRDNPFIDHEAYEKQLRASCATDPELLKAWLNGDWSINRGAFFAQVLSDKNMLEPWKSLPGIKRNHHAY